MDWTGGQIKNNDSSDDVKNVDLTQVHYLSGPITVEGAQPGDLLKVEFLNLGPLDDDEWVSRFADIEFLNCYYGTLSFLMKYAYIFCEYYLNQGFYGNFCERKWWWILNRSFSEGD